MAKLSAIERNKRRAKVVRKYAARRAKLTAMARDLSLAPEERFQAHLRSRCELSGRPRGYYRKFRLSRIALRELASYGQIPGMVKASW